VKRRRAIVALAALLTAGAAAEETGPRIRVEPESFDFGRVQPHRTLRKDFRLLNLGDRNLEISRISRSCACTRAVADEMTLEPGQATPLHVEIETRDSSGRIEQRVLVRSNDPQTPVLEVRVSATVVAPDSR
jgi:Protein of unknown function (DUF1573)